MEKPKGPEDRMCRSVTVDGLRGQTEPTPDATIKVGSGTDASLPRDINPMGELQLGYNEVNEEKHRQEEILIKRRNKQSL